MPPGRPTAFLLHRLHALSGLVPVGLFVILHLFTNFQLLVGDFQHEVDFIHSLPALLWLEVTLWLSIAFHAGLGLYYTFTGNRPNAVRYAWGDNWRYLLQRISGLIALVFIVLHVATLRWQIALGEWFTPFVVHGPDGAPLAAASTARALQYAWWIPILYAVGVASVVYHWANGLWSAGITWGVTVTPAAQRRWGRVCAGIGLVLAVFGAGAIVGALRHEVTEAEARRIEAKGSETSGTAEKGRR